jgi:hypothetical protein
MVFLLEDLNVSENFDQSLEELLKIFSQIIEEADWETGLKEHFYELSCFAFNDDCISHFLAMHEFRA